MLNNDIIHFKADQIGEIKKGQKDNSKVNVHAAHVGSVGSTPSFIDSP